MNAHQLMVGAAVMAAAAGVLLVWVGVVARRPPLRELGVAAVVGSMVLAALQGPGDGGDRALLVAPLLVGSGEIARLLSDGRRRSHRQHIERSCFRGAFAAIALVGTVGVALSLLARTLPHSLWPAAVPDGAVPTGTIPGETVPSGMVPIGMATLVGTVGVVAWGLRGLGLRRQAVRRPLVALSAMVLALVVATVVLASAALARVPGSKGGAAKMGTLGTSGQDGPSTAEAVGRRGRVLPQLPTLGDPGALTVLVLAVAVLVVLVILTRRMQLVPPEDLVPDPVLHLPLEAAAGSPLTVQTVSRSVTVAVLDEALVELRQDADPRVAVRLAYAIVSRGMGDPALVRRAAESEGEYLQRALSRLGAGAGPLRDLTNLFRRARFSDDPVDETMRAAALVALEEIRAEVHAQPNPSSMAADR